jgi:hypothetical protein
MKKGSIQTKGKQVFNIPNTAEGEEFKRLFYKFLNRKRYGCSFRNRGPRPKGCDYDTPKHLAEWFAVYMNYKQDDGHQQTVDPSFLLVQLNYEKDMRAKTQAAYYNLLHSLTETVEKARGNK